MQGKTLVRGVLLLKEEFSVGFFKSIWGSCAKAASSSSDLLAIGKIGVAKLVACKSLDH